MIGMVMTKTIMMMHNDGNDDDDLDV